MEKHLSRAEVFGKNIFPVQPYTLVEKNEPSVFFFARLLKRRLKRREKKELRKKSTFFPFSSSKYSFSHHQLP
jgi:hypothetical protein